MIDQVDIVAHDSYKRLLAQKDNLIQRVIPVRHRAAGNEQPAPPAQDQASDEERFEVTEQVSQGTIRVLTHFRPADSRWRRDVIDHPGF